MAARKSATGRKSSTTADQFKGRTGIPHFHEKPDHLLKRVWMRLPELQEVLLELMKELAERKPS